MIGEHEVVLLTQGSAGVVAVRYRHRHAIAGASELVRKIVHVHGAVCAEVVVENEENVAHAKRRL